MNFELSEDKINHLVEEEVRKEIKNRITKVMNDGCASWFTQQNIQNITRQCVDLRIKDNMIADAIKAMDKDELKTAIAESVYKAITYAIG